MPAFLSSLLKIDYPKGKLSLFFLNASSQDNTLDLLEEFIPRLQAEGFKAVHITRPNNGFGAGQNMCIRLGEAPFILVINPDTQIYPDALKNVVNEALRSPENVGSWEFRQTPYEHPKFYDPITLETTWSSHACILLKRSAYNLIGGYDERIFMYGEDVEFSYRLRLAGFKLKYCPRALVRHDTYKESFIKPLQYVGSIYANLYIRLKFGSLLRKCEGFFLCWGVLRRPSIFQGSRRYVVKYLWHNRLNLLHALFSWPKGRSSVYIGFYGYDYEFIREGAYYPAKALPIQRPKVTVITRTIGLKGRDHLLSQALYSVAEQTYPNIEHIIVEDGSDVHQGLVEKFREVRTRDIKFIRSCTKGRSFAGNLGLSQANGSLCLFLDDDDLLFPDHIETLVAALHDNSHAVAVYTLAYEVITSYSKKKPGHYKEINYIKNPQGCQEFSYDLLCGRNLMPIQSVLFEKSLFDRCGGFDTRLEALEDWMLWKKYARQGTFVMVPKTTSLYRTPVGSAFRKRCKEVSANNLCPDILEEEQKVS